VARAARALGEPDDFPPAEALVRVFAGPPPVRFVEASPRRRRAPLDPRELYDARVTLEKVVPTRPRCWHDFMNALVWGSFPRAKSALHARQHRAIAARIAPGACRLPAARTPELDALALLDEGGIVLVADDPDAARAALRSRQPGAIASQVDAGAMTVVVFGHAVYESLALRVPPAVAAAIVIARGSSADIAKAADAALERLVGNDRALLSPRELARIDLREVGGGPRCGAAKSGAQSGAAESSAADPFCAALEAM
jgi:hypothetical protein